MKQDRWRQQSTREVHQQLKPEKYNMNPLKQLKSATLPLLITFTLVCFTLSPSVEAVLPPPAPEGGYPGQNTAVGQFALNSLTTGEQNTATGSRALYSITTGSNNTATGLATLHANETGNANTATGAEALHDNTGDRNTASGANALANNTSGENNTAMGTGALLNNKTGVNNIALGSNAGSNITNNNNIDIGSQGVARDTGVIRIGTRGTHRTTLIAGIFGSSIGRPAAPVYVDETGALAAVPSSQRFKDNIRPMNQSSEVLFALKPVTFHYKKELDPAGMQQFGLVAEQVEKVNPDLVVRESDGKPYTVRYDQVNAMLLNEFLKEHQTVQELRNQVAALTAGLRKVSAQIESTKPGRQTVSNQY